MIEPRPQSGNRSERAVQIADRALEPDRGRMKPADRGKLGVLHPQRNEASRSGARHPQRQMDIVLLAPESQQIAPALAEFLSRPSSKRPHRPRSAATAGGPAPACAPRSAGKSFAHRSSQLRGNGAEPAHHRLGQPQPAHQHEREMQKQRHISRLISPTDRSARRTARPATAGSARRTPRSIRTPARARATAGARNSTTPA